MKEPSRILDKFLLTPKLLYFVAGTVVYSLHQFRTSFTHVMYGITKNNFGLCFSFAQIAVFLSNLWIAAICDEYTNLQLILPCLILPSALIFHLFFYVKSPLSFWLLFTPYYSLLAPVLPLIDRAILGYLKNSPNLKESSYGSQRVFSTIAFFITGFIIEYICDLKLGHENFSNLKWYNLSAALFASILIFLLLPKAPKKHSNYRYFASMSRLAKNYEALYLMFIVLLCGIVRSAMTNYLGMYYRDVIQLKPSNPPYMLFRPFSWFMTLFYKSKESTLSTAAATVELFIFFNSGYILEYFGLFVPLFVALICQLVRFVAYLCLNPRHEYVFGLCCLIEVLKGISYSLIQLPAAILITKLTPPQLHSTSQVLFNGCFIALGTLISGIIFKFVFTADSSAPFKVVRNEYKLMFAICVLISLLTLLLFMVKYFVADNLLFNRSKADEKLSKIEASHSDI